jgi:uncharacterized Ntn-hydrolase superfamily protein
MMLHMGLGKTRLGSFARGHAVAVGLCAGLFVPSVASATWSIVGVDPGTGQVGIAVASCYSDVRVVAGFAPGYGMVAAQAYLDFAYNGRTAAVNALLAGLSPQEALDAATDPGTDSGFQNRQYGIVALGFEDGSVSFTGSGADEWKGDVQGWGVAVQGNLLEGESVIMDSLAAYEAAGEQCPTALADQLMDALEAGSAEGGDARCPPLTAWSAYLAVANPGDPADAPSISFFIPDQSNGGSNPVTLLREEFDAWREQNPLDDSDCDGTETGTDGSGDSGSESGGDDGSGDDGGTGDGSDDGGGSDGGGSDGDDGGGGATDEGTGSSGTAAEGSGSDDSGKGCGCVSGPTSGAVLLLLPLLARRSSRRGQ